MSHVSEVFQKVVEDASHLRSCCYDFDSAGDIHCGYTCN